MAVTENILASVEVKDVAEYEEELYLFLDRDPEGAAAMEEIRATGDLSEETGRKLRASLETYTEQFLNRKREK